MMKKVRKSLIIFCSSKFKSIFLRNSNTLLFKASPMK